MKPLDVLVAVAALAVLLLVARAWPMVGEVRELLELLDDSKKTQQ